ncbi:hypothetical protein BH09SUM1_BH09SUM1_30200 [soil metagenome]
MPPGLQGASAPLALHPMLQKVEDGGPRDWVLNMNELAVAAMRAGDRELAKKCLDESMLNISDVFGRTPEAAKARSIFFNEHVKLFKGDPYERSMTFFYRGVLYMQDADWGNARACFRSAELQDAFAEEEQDRADWTLFDYLIALCSARMGDGDEYVRESYRRAKDTYTVFPERYRAVVGGDPINADPAMLRMPRVTDNLLVIIATGRGPLKKQRGKYREFLAYQRPPNMDTTASVTAGDQAATNSLTVDSVYYQARTRGGRAFDTIQGRKVFFKSTAESIATVGAVAGYGIFSSAGSSSNGNDQALAGLIILGAAGLFELFSELVATQADTRQWYSLPDALGIYESGAVPAGPQKIAVDYPASRHAEAVVDIPPSGKGMAVVLAFPGTEPVLLTSQSKPQQQPEPLPTPTTPQEKKR